MRDLWLVGDPPLALVGMSDTLQSIKNFRQASPEVATSGQPGSEHFAAMAAAGYVAVINLALHDNPSYSLVDEPGDVGAANMGYVHIPVQFDHPAADDLARFMAAMDTYQGRKIWIHCAANIRVTAFLGLYRVLRQNWERTRAFELMYSVWEPNEVWSVFIDDALSGGSERSSA
jgi:protein tyrosine phosphatase (PTP) superfamily phosphohydrolase (DUF442 family)